MPTVICDTCGASFKTSFWQARRAHHFCNPRCYQDWRRTRKGNLNPHWKGGPITKVCPICQEPFNMPPCTQNYRKYCSKKCKALSQRDGKKHIHYANGWVDRIKQAVRDRDSFTCQMCGSKQNLIVHHLDNDKASHAMANLITWCRSCHCRYHNYLRFHKLLSCCPPPNDPSEQRHSVYARSFN